MNMKLIKILITLIIKMSSDVMADQIICKRDVEDRSSCVFNKITAPDELYKLSGLIDTNSSEVKKIKFIDSRMYHLPSEVTKTYNNVEDLDFSHTHISRFDGMDFADTNKIIKLNASYNAIHSLPKALTLKFRYLQTLDLSNNYIEIIENDAFSFNSNLTYLNLSNNIIEVIDRGFLIAVRSVKVLNLSVNKISEIRGYLSDIQFSFEEIYLNDNHLTTIDPMMVKNLAILDISRNKLEGHFNFNNMKFKELYVSANFIETLSVSSSLEKLDASNSNERMFKLNFGSGSWLKELKLSNLDIVDYDHLLKQIKHFTHLESLDLSHNNLESFDFQEAAKFLKVLNLERTNLRSIENLRNAKFLIPNLKEVNIQDNLFECSELPGIIDSFKYQNINLTGLVDGNLKEFVEKNCAPPSHRGDHPVCHTESSGTLVFFFVVSLLMNVMVVAAFLYNKYEGFGKNPAHFLMRDF